MSLQFLKNGSAEARFVNAISLKEACERAGIPTDWESYANRVICRSGKHPSDAWVLLYRHDFNSLTQNTTHTIRLSNCLSGDSQADLDLPGWVVRSATAIDPSLNLARSGGTYDEQQTTPVDYFTQHLDQVLLVHLQDRRFWFTKGEFETDYNVVKSVTWDTDNENSNPSDNDGYEDVTCYPSTLNGTSLWTWKNVLDDIRDNYLPFATATILPTGGFSLPDDTETDKAEHPLNVRANGRSAWDVFCDLLAATGHTLRHDISTGYFAITPIYDGSSTTSNTISGLLEESKIGDEWLPIEHRVHDHLQELLPEKVRVVFPSRIFNTTGVPTTVEEIVPQDLIEEEAQFTFDITSSSKDLDPPGMTALTGAHYHVKASGYLYYTTSRWEQASPSPANRRKDIIETVAGHIAQRYIRNLQTTPTEFLFYGAVDLDPDELYPIIEYDFSLFSGHPTTTKAISGPCCLNWPENTRTDAKAEVEVPLAKWAYVVPNEDIEADESGTAYFLWPKPTYNTEASAEELDFTDQTITETVWNGTTGTINSGGRYLAFWDYRIDRWVIPLGDNALPHIMHYGVVGAYDATNKVITNNGTPISLPSSTPPVPAATKVFDREATGFSPGDTFYAIKQINVHTDGTHGQVDWVVIPTSASTNRLFIVTVDKKSESQGPGSWVTPHLEGHRYFSGSLNTTPDVGDIWLLSNDHHNDPVDSRLAARIRTGRGCPRTPSSRPIPRAKPGIRATSRTTIRRTRRRGIIPSRPMAMNKMTSSGSHTTVFSGMQRLQMCR